MKNQQTTGKEREKKKEQLFSSFKIKKENMEKEREKKKEAKR